jgi:hypothetical protein
MLLFQSLGSGGSRAKLRSLLPVGDILVHGEVRDWEYHQVRINGLAMEVRVSALLRDVLGVLGFIEANMQGKTFEVQSLTFQGEKRRFSLHWQ